jgi:hypothetical protein
MAYRWNARADTVSTVVLWVGSLVAALVCVAWLAKNISPDHMVMQSVDNELTMLQQDLNTACRMDRFWKSYYPKLNQGTLIINDMQVCVDSSECRVVYYGNGSEPQYEGSTITINTTAPCTNIELCHSYYYSSDSPAFVGSDYVFMANATACSNKHLPILRCRLLTCSLNRSLTVSLTGITLVNMTKNESGVFTLAAY